MPEDNRIILAVLGGDVNAYGRLVVKYQTPIYNLFYRATQCTDTALDLTQDTFIRAYQNLERFNTGKRFFPWLYAIGLNLARDHLRKIGRRNTHIDHHADICEIPDACPDPVIMMERTVTRRRVAAALIRLPLDYREALLLRFREELSMKEIAAALSISVSGAKMRVSRGLKKLKTLLQSAPEPSADTAEASSNRNVA